MSAADPRALIGRWSFERLIEDLSSSEQSAASGRCELKPAGDDLILWHEQATLNHAGRDFTATRDLRIARQADAWHVLFEDGRYFHPWSPGERVLHPCGEDLYEGRIEVTTPPANAPISTWQITWRVQGPRKNLRIQTHLTAQTLPNPSNSHCQSGKSIPQGSPHSVSIPGTIKADASR